MPIRAGLASLLLIAPGAAAAASWSMGPAPAWVRPMDAPSPPEAAPDDVASGTYDLVFDHQVRVTDQATDEYVRRVVQVLSASGVQNASQISVDFDPAAERLVLHQVRILRGGRDVSSFRSSDVSVIRPERESDEGIYSGTLSALVFLRDVRQGDVLDYAYSLLGTAPSTAPSFAQTLDMAYSVPVARLRHRLLWPKGRSLHRKDRGALGPPRTEDLGAFEVYTWTRDAVPAIVEEGDLPSWFDPYPAVELGEFASWREVAGWTAGLYEAADLGAPALDALVGQWASRGALEERALAAVRFVQDDVRYLGLEMGPGAYQPRPPAEVLARRYGDCKDKSLLLSTLLRRMGLDARPALVSTHAGRSLDSQLPSLLAFDHVIVRLRLGGVTRWIDATTAHQGGRLRDIVPPPYERALVIDASSPGLEPVPQPMPEDPTTLVEEEYAAPGAGPGTLKARVLYRGSDADDMRATLADTSPADLASSYLNHYAGSWPALQPVGTLDVQDQRDQNRIEIRAAYQVPDFGGEGTHNLEAWSLSDVVERPGTVRRTMPLAVAHPTKLRHRVSVRLPSEPDDSPEDAVVDDPAFRFSRSSELARNSLALRFDYETRADAVAPADLTRHLADLDRARAELRLPFPRATGRAARRRLAIGAALALPALVVAWALVRARRRRMRS